MNTGLKNITITKHTINHIMMYCCMPEITHCGD